jgi:uracil phosphoribosyltransferase
MTLDKFRPDHTTPFMPLHVLQHPVARHYLTRLRTADTRPALFRRYCHIVTTALLLEATRDLPEHPVQIETPLERMDTHELEGEVVVVSILRAGLGMCEPFTEILPRVSIGYLGLERDEETAQARAYYRKLPPITGKRVFVVDPMLATGGSALLALDQVMEEAPAAVSFLCIVAAPEGVERLHAKYPALPIFAGALDRQLDERKYIRPGLGDFGDRLYGTGIGP